MNTQDKESINKAFRNHLDEFDRAMAEVQKARADMFGVTDENINLNKISKLHNRICALYRVINPENIE